MTDRPGGREMGGYLLLSYGTAWGIWLMCGMMPPGAVTAQLLNTVVMWTPALAVWLMWLAGRRRPVLSFSMRPALRRNWKWYLAAWALSLAAAVLGALLYFGVYPRDFDSTLPALAPMMEQAGISRGTAVSLLLGVLVYGPVINLFFAIGEEIGWRGFLYPALRQRMSTLPACLPAGGRDLGFVAHTDQSYGTQLWHQLSRLPMAGDSGDVPLYHLGRHFPGLAVGEERFPLAGGAGPRDDQRRRTGRSAVPGGGRGSAPDLGSCRHRHTGGDAHAGPVGCPSGAEGKLAEKLVKS